MTDQRMSRKFHVKRRNDISRIFDEGRRSADGLLTLLAVQNGLEFSRMAMGVSKRHGNAVRRNRIRRLCREAFRLSRRELPAGWDFMIIPRPGGDFTLPKLQASLIALGRKTVERRA